jgi:hypothetical protein
MVGSGLLKLGVAKHGHLLLPPSEIAECLFSFLT